MRPYVLLHPMDTSNHCSLCVYGCFFTQTYNLLGGEGLVGAGTEAFIILDELITLPALPNLLVSQGVWALIGGVICWGECSSSCFGGRSSYVRGCWVGYNRRVGQSRIRTPCMTVHVMKILSSLVQERWSQTRLEHMLAKIAQASKSQNKVWGYLSDHNAFAF